MPCCRNSKCGTLCQRGQTSRPTTGPDRVQGGVTGLDRSTTLWEAPMRRGCGRSDGVCSSQFEASSSTGQRLRTCRDRRTGNTTAGPRQTGARNSRRPFVTASRANSTSWAMWAESPAHDRGTPSWKQREGFGSEGLRRAWNQVLAAVRPKYCRTYYASLSKLTPSHAHI